MPTIEQQKQELARTIEEVTKQLDELNNLPTEPDPGGEIAMIWFQKTFGTSERPWTYCAVRSGNGLWYFTANADGVRGLTWDELLQRIRRDEPVMPTLWFATQVEQL